MSSTATHAPTAQLASGYANRLAIKADRLFLWLATLQSAGSLALAWYQGQWTPFLAVTLPSLLLMLWQARFNPGTRLTSVTTALVLMALVAATIQQAHGLVEMHFGVFVILALLLYYRDWLPVVVAAAAIAVHHLAFYWLQARGLPVQAFSAGSGFGIVVLHAGYVIVETAFVCVMAVQLRRQLDALDHEAEALAQLADTLAKGDALPPAIMQQHFRAGSLAQALVRMSAQVQERITTQQQLLQENRRIRLALDASAMAVAIVDTQGDAIYRNHSFAQLSARSDAHTVQQALAEAAQRRAVESGAGARALGALQLQESVTPVHDHDGTPLGVVVEWQDRTQSLLLEAQLTTVIAQATRGELGARLHGHAHDSTLGQLAEGINRFLAVTEDSLQDMRRMLAALAHGDLSQRIDRPCEGVFDHMKRDANATADALARIIVQIRSSSGAINAVTGHILHGNDALEQQVRRQSITLGEAAQQMQAVLGTMQQHSAQAADADVLAAAASEAARAGGDTMGKAMGTMQQMEAASRRIQDIIAVIDGLAFQTNILALNAAVEAARAGDEGRGFAVVASEVRALALRSSTAASQIKALIGESVAHVEAGVQQVRSAGAGMQHIVTTIGQVSSTLSTIAVASEQEAGSIAQVHQTLSRVDIDMRDGVLRMQEASTAARAMGDHAAQLEDAVSLFVEDAAPTAQSAARQARHAA
ncbi:methyl-accepting chemotaxis protein [Xanthomonas campestris pv. campestris]|uniref:methyl-accepting chemotaxis protein n=1 Tax=Xanthomonas campestris TaxID=339 RepID=UPI000A7D8358|nr:methyl-accepting chemotaxis protein [Xanthomonas campestris]MEA0700884.1 methyl-accepting chemotaxis protein [Xanthomonas campestris pv. campestris]MEA0779368.1 methyl-accepting chemotaxis protein [Xanthomonas campestris pv. campestris]MEA0788181.1 methyl-accepting chemotaxis protein [Xanthomonas campestris pv. campestris]MEA0862333.1 methyl-accepting chemotaxis protein [Xanthomonas campestris pv. campestris]MEA0944198.1 methyl-accepting chemotaxis protein [Xanthomonas campestris pv. campes